MSISEVFAVVHGWPDLSGTTRPEPNPVAGLDRLVMRGARDGTAESGFSILLLSPLDELRTPASAFDA
jgi:hypothetical protein